MNQEDRFFTESLGGFLRPTELEKQLDVIWARYYVETERTDRRCPGRWSPYAPESWLPWPGTISAAAARFARQAHQRAERNSLAHGANRKQVLEAKERVQRLGFSAQQKLADLD